MAATDAKPVPTKAAATRITFPILDNDGDLVTGATGLDSEISKDAGTFADCANEATEIATNSGVYYLDLTAAEMTADTVAVIVKTSTADAKTTVLVVYPAEAADIPTSNAGIGAITFTYTLTSSADASPIADADIWATSDAAGNTILASGKTNASGQVVFYLDAGTVYVWRQKSGWNFTNPDTETVA